jgi:hypothetical protein
MTNHYEHDDSVQQDARVEAAHTRPAHAVDCDCVRCEAAYERYLEEQDSLDRQGNELEDEDDEEPEQPQLVTCPACSGDGLLLGRMGEVVWYRCRACGIDFRRGCRR